MGAKFSTTEIFIKKAKNKHKNYYDYSLVNYCNSKNKIKIICPTHGMFLQDPASHIKGKGCYSCGQIKRSKNAMLTQEEFLKRSKKIHKNYYNYILANYINSVSKIKIICPIHGIFELTPAQHITNKKRGCKICGGNRNFRDTEKFIKDANKIHNNKYDYSLSEFKRTDLKIKIICKQHGIFEQVVNGHLSGAGCPRCCDSKGEVKIYEFLKNNNILFERERKFNNCLGKRKNPLKFDFYLIDYDTCIEFDGPHHYKIIKYFGKESFLRTQRNDKIKNKYCDDNNITLIRIKYDEINIIDKILIEKLKMK